MIHLDGQPIDVDSIDTSLIIDREISNILSNIVDTVSCIPENLLSYDSTNLEQFK